MNCPGCGHNFYNDKPLGDGMCKYCHEDDKGRCYVCGKKAMCTGYGGYLCRDEGCLRSDE